MTHLPDLIRDLAIILVAAGLVTLLFKRLKQPVVLGYILAGFLVSPHVPLFPTIHETGSIKVWAEIGVIFLLFGLGLEFSFKKLARVGGSASITAFFEITALLISGYFTGRLLGWSKMDSLFLGGMLSISSTTIIIRAFEELGVKSQKFAQLVFGVLIVEDLAAILLLVLLTTLAISNRFQSAEMLGAVVKLSFFLLLWFVAGIFAIPSMLKRARNHLDGETLLVLSLALCLLMVVLATKAGFSPALGAFVMGSILAETREAETIEHLLAPVKQLFAAIFFVSVGILMNPKILIDHWGVVLIIAAVTIGIKILSTALGALISGQALKPSVQAGMSLGQIGEFSFIIATLGLDLAVTSAFLFPIAVAVSAITTFTTPYMIRLSIPTYEALNRRLPKRWKDGITRYSAASQRIAFEGEWHAVIKSTLTRVALNAVLVIAIFQAGVKLLRPLANEHLGTGLAPDLLTLFVTLLVASPFLWALALGEWHRPKAVEDLSEHRYRGPILAFELGRIVLAFLLVAGLLSSFSPTFLAFMILLLGLTGVLFLASGKLRLLYRRFENNFLLNLQGHAAEHPEKPEAVLAPWDAHIAYYDVHPDADLVGQTLQELRVREHLGITIALIERGQQRLTAPGGTERIFPFDRLGVIGTDEQLEKFQNLLAVGERKRTAGSADYSLQQLPVDDDSPWSHKTIRDSGLREKTHGLIVGVERGVKRILNPESAFTLKPGDVLWIVGETAKIKRLAR